MHLDRVWGSLFHAREVRQVGDRRDFWFRHQAGDAGHQLLVVASERGDRGSGEALRLHFGFEGVELRLWVGSEWSIEARIGPEECSELLPVTW